MSKMAHKNRRDRMRRRKFHNVLKRKTIEKTYQMWSWGKIESVTRSVEIQFRKWEKKKERSIKKKLVGRFQAAAGDTTSGHAGVKRPDILSARMGRGYRLAGIPDPDLQRAKRHPTEFGL